MYDIYSSAKKYFKNNAFISLLSGSIFAQVITLSTLPLITRLYSLDDMGLISIFISFISIPSAIAFFKFENAILVYRNLDESRPLWLILLFSILVVSIITFILFFIFHYYAIFGLDHLPLWSSAFVILIILFSGTANVVKSLLIRNRDYHSIAKLTVFKNVQNALLRIIGGILGGGLVSLLFAELLCMYSFFVEMLKRDMKYIIRTLRETKASDALEEAKNKKKFPLFESPSVLLDQLNAILPLLLIAQMLGPAFTALFSLSYRITFLPGSHLGASMGEMFRGKFSQLYRDYKFCKAKALLRNSIKKVFLMSLIFYIPIYILVPEIIPIVFGEKWRASSDLVKYITPWAATSFVVSTLSSVFSVMQIQYLKLIYDVSALLLLGAVLYFLPVNNLLDFTKAICISNIASNIIYFVLILITLKKLSKCVVSPV